MDNVMILIDKIPILFSILLFGAALCLPFYRWNVRKFLQSQLGVKVFMWIPLYIFFAVVVSSTATAFLCGLIVLYIGYKEWYMHKQRKKALPYMLYFAAGCVSWAILVEYIPLPQEAMALILSSVMSDVFAFFFGKYGGRHKLPKFLNANKSYEGVVGQIIGGVIGVQLFGSIFNVDISLGLGLLIGVATAIGDLMNSYYKRKLQIKDWATTIPGHGGVLDRFSSLNMATIVLGFFSVYTLFG